MTRNYDIEKANEENVQKGDIYFALALGSCLVPTTIRDIDQNGFNYGKRKEGVFGYRSFDTMEGVIVHKNKKRLLVLTNSSEDYEINNKALEELLKDNKLLN